MQWSSLMIVALAAPTAYAGMLRFACGQLVTQRLDPLVNPGVAPSPHMHQIVGGNAFNTTMDPTKGDISQKASCTTCTFSEDFSNYWTAVLYFRAKNGTFKRVPQLANQYLEQANGGMTVYYVSPDDKSVNITAFKPGFRMLAGDASARKAANGFVNLYRCYDGKNFQPNPGGVASTDTQNMPTKYCAGGIRVNTFFPTCWDGKNLDSANHQSHVSYGYGNGCPSSHPVQLPQVFIETVWDTGRFDKSLWPDDGSQPFVWSQGDQTGYGHHADYVFGWKGDVLQKAMDARCDFNCPQLKTQGYPAANQCNQKQIVQENLDTWLTSLPGGMMVG